MISIIIPIYNVEQYIGDCLDSIYRQSYESIEVILVDDCSPDRSMLVAKPYIDKLNEKFVVKVVRHEKNRGLSAARNTGVKEAAGEWLYFLDSDDEICPTCIGLFVSMAKKYPLVDFIIGGVRVIGKNVSFKLTTPEIIVGQEQVLKSYIRGMWYEMAWNKLVKRHFFISNQLWFVEGLLHEDQLFSYQLSTVASSMATIAQPTYLYKMRTSGTITSCSKRQNFEAYIYILDYMTNSILQKYSMNDFAVECPQVIRFAYSILLSLYGEHSLTKSDVAMYESKVYRLCAKIAFYKHHLPVTVFIKKLIMTLPRIIRINVLTWHYKSIN